MLLRADLEVAWERERGRGRRLALRLAALWRTDLAEIEWADRVELRLGDLLVLDRRAPAFRERLRRLIVAVLASPV